MAHIGVVNPFHTTVAIAVRLAARRAGVTAPDLAQTVPCTLRTAQRTLALLARDGLLVATTPARKGKRRGDWRTVYRATRGDRHGV